MNLASGAGPLGFIQEPLLEFRYGQGLADPRDGLTAFGPFDADLPGHPANVGVGLVATADGKAAYRAWAEAVVAPVWPDADDALWPGFPGFEAAFACGWSPQPARTYVLDAAALTSTLSEKDSHKRVGGVVDAYLKGIEVIHKSGDPVDVVVYVVPDEVWLVCRPLSRVREGRGYEPSKNLQLQRAAGQTELWETIDPDMYQYSIDFRRQIKARAMEFGLPIQIIRESTLRMTPPKWGDRQLTPVQDRAWNLLTTLYYKAGGKPWRLTSAREGVCYIGIAYRKNDTFPNERSACCAAQMFLDSGDGIVFMGEYGPWYSPERDQFHLEPGAARRLLEGALKTYSELDGRPLKEVFLHSRSGISEQEFRGFEQGCPSGTKLVGIRVRRWVGGIRLYRDGLMPVPRGTWWPLNPTRSLLWGSGYKARLGTYDGSEVPWPLRIDIQHGTADIEQVTKDILGLTKLNYNACRLGESEPVTVGFSDAVGEILVSNPSVKYRRPQFKFYI